MALPPIHSKYPTRQIARVQAVNTHDIIVEFFTTFGEGPFDIEAVVYFVLLRMDVTPYDFNVVSNSIRQYIMDTFPIKQGRFKTRLENHLRQVLVSYKF